LYFTGQEGAGRSSDKEFNHFLSISLGSIVEVDTQLLISMRLGYLNSDDYHMLELELTNIRKMVIGLKKFVQSKTQK
jgi:four helix bundle protein